MSSYQAFRIFLQFIANSNWEKRGISIADREKYPSLVSEREWGGRERNGKGGEGGREGGHLASTRFRMKNCPIKATGKNKWQDWQ